MKSSWVRRPITGLGVCFLAIALTVTLPVWAILTMVVDAVRGRWRFPIPRLIAFATCWAWLETSGLVVALFLFFTGRGRSVPAHYALQTWWCRSLIQALGFTVGLQITVEGAEHVIRIPIAPALFQPVLATVPLQVFAYEMAVVRGNDVDQPRNLAKSVTVE